MTFRVGQRVVCVNPDGTHERVDYKELVKGAIYTVSGLGFCEKYNHTTLLLDEIPFRVVFRNCTNEVIGSRDDVGFGAHRFRPLTDTKTSVSFTEGAPRDSERFDNRRKQKVRA